MVGHRAIGGRGEIYLFRTLVLQHDISAIHELILNYTYGDFPLYIIIALSFVSSMIISEKLLVGYDLSLVIPLSRSGILPASAGYVARRPVRED